MSDQLLHKILLSSPAFNAPMNMMVWHEPESVYYSVGAGMVLLGDLIRKPFKYLFSFRKHTFCFHTDQTIFFAINALDTLKPHAKEIMYIPVPDGFYDSIKVHIREGDEWKMADFDFTTWPFMWKFEKSVECELLHKLEGYRHFMRGSAEEDWKLFKDLSELAPQGSQSENPKSPGTDDPKDLNLDNLDFGIDTKQTKKPPSGSRY